MRSQVPGKGETGKVLSKEARGVIVRNNESNAKKFERRNLEPQGELNGIEWDEDGYCLWVSGFEMDLHVTQPASRRDCFVLLPESVELDLLRN